MLSSKSWLWFQILGQFHHFLIIYQIMKREKSQLKPLQWFLFIWLIIMMMMVIMMETGINGKRRHKTVCYVLLCCIFFIHITASNSHFEIDKRLRSYDLSNQSVKLILCIVQGNLPHFTFSPWLDEQNTVCWKPTYFVAKFRFDYIS